MNLQFPILFDENEYSKELGLYQKWIHGYKDEQIPKLYSMSAFQAYSNNRFITADYQKYAEYLQLSTEGILKPTTDWHIRLYIDESILNPLNPDMEIWKGKLDHLMNFSRV